MNIKDFIYLDYNATTPIDLEVFQTMLPYLKENFANPSSSHGFGKKINQEIIQARKNISSLINADPSEIIFTSGATEAINLAIKGVAENYLNKGKHIITVSTEHKAVLDTCRDLETKGYDVTFMPVLNNGLIDLFELKKYIRNDTVLVSVMHVNNETYGSIPMHYELIMKHYIIYIYI